MSILSYPRINFRGQFKTNPCTANNDDVMPTVVERDVDGLGDDLANMTDEQVWAFLRQPVTKANGPDAACKTYVRSGWNLYGDFFTTFEQTTITSVVSGPGANEQATTAAQDPAVGMTLSLLGAASADPARRNSPVLCDLDSTGLVTTQLWIGGLQIGSGGPSGTDPSQMTLLDHDTRAFQNWLNFMSTVSGSNAPYGGEQNFVCIGCEMQFAIPAAKIPASIGFASPGVKALFAAGKAAAGLVVRYRCYEVQPNLTSAELAAGFAANNPSDNPAYGYLVGTVGVWEKGEPETEPAGRKLTTPYDVPTGQPGQVGRPAMSWQSPDGKWSGGSPAAPLPWQAPPALIGVAVARVQPGMSVISLDLVQTFPKYGFRDPNGPAKGSPGFSAPKTMANVGLVQLAVIPAAGGAPQVLANIDYGLGDYSKYDAMGGIVDIPFPPAMAATIASGTLVIQGAASSRVNAGVQLLKENVIRVVTDDRTMYLPPGAKNQRIRIKVYDRGGPTRVPTVLYPVEYKNLILVQKDAACQSRPNQTVGPQPPGILSFPASVTIPAGQGYTDWFEIPFSATGTGATVIQYQPDTVKWDPNVPAWTGATYSSIRVYANDDFSALYAKGPLQWADVYENALRYYYLITPAMSRFFPLNVAQSVVGNGALIKQRLNVPGTPGFFLTSNMPITRTMSPAKVKLVHDFIDQQMAKKATVA